MRLWEILDTVYKSDGPYGSINWGEETVAYFTTVEKAIEYLKERDDNGNMRLREVDCPIDP
jgi:hypothetical protein